MSGFTQRARPLDDQRLARLAKARTRTEVIMKAIEGRLKWHQAATILGVSDRQNRRITVCIDKQGFDAVQDFRNRSWGRKRISAQETDKISTLRRKQFADFSIAHFHEFLIAKHDLKILEKTVRLLLQGTRPGSEGAV